MTAPLAHERNCAHAGLTFEDVAPHDARCHCLRDVSDPDQASQSGASYRSGCITLSPHGYVCTLPRGHDGEHAAQGENELPPFEVWS